MNFTFTNSRRAFTLIEAIAVIVVIAVTVPPAVLFLDSAAQRREDAVQAQRAATLAQSRVEFVLADVASSDPKLGFAALANLPTYTTEFTARAEPLTNQYQALGFTYTIQASPLVAASGSATGNAAQDIFRIVTVTVTAPRAGTAPININFSTLVGDF